MKLTDKKKSLAKKMLRQKGRESLYMPKSKTGKNEGETMYLGKNENNRA